MASVIEYRPQQFRGLNRVRALSDIHLDVRQFALPEARGPGEWRSLVCHAQRYEIAPGERVHESCRRSDSERWAKTACSLTVTWGPPWCRNTVSCTRPELQFRLQAPHAQRRAPAPKGFPPHRARLSPCAQAQPHTSCQRAQSAFADLVGEEAIQAQHLAEALQYRPRSMIQMRFWFLS